RVTVLPPLLAIQMLRLSAARPAGPSPTVNVPTSAPSSGRSFVTERPKKLVTQIAAPSYRIANGPFATRTLVRIAPSVGRSLVIESSRLFTTQRPVPSQARVVGGRPAGVVRAL